MHNLYRNAWDNIILHRDNFAQTRPPQQWALDFRNETLDAFTKNSGPALRRAAMRLMRHPLFRDAHGTDDHYAPVLFCAGAAGDQDDVGTKNTSPAEVWELEQMCNVRRRPLAFLLARSLLTLPRADVSPFVPAVDSVPNGRVGPDQGVRGLSSGAHSSLCSHSLSSCTPFCRLSRELRRALRANDLRVQLEKVNEKGQRLIERAAYTCAGIVALERAREKQRDQTEVRAEIVWLRRRGRASEGARALERSSCRRATNLLRACSSFNLSLCS